MQAIPYLPQNLPEALTGPLLDSFLQQQLLSVSLFDANLVWLYSNPVWYETTRDAPYQPVHLFELLPQLKPILLPSLPHLKAGIAVPRQSVQLELNGRFVYWQIAVIPLMVETELAGILILLDDNSEHILSQKQLERRVADRTQKLSALYDVITATAEAPDLRSTLTWSLRRVLDAIKCPAGAIQLIDDFDEQADVEALRLVASEGLSEEIERDLAETAVHTGLFSLAIASEKPVVIANLHEHHSVPSALYQQTNLQTYVGVAMIVRGRVVGVLTVFAENGRRFGEIELALLDSVADQIGIVVENAYLHKQAEEAAVVEERHRLARELHDSVTQAIYSLTLFTEAGMRLLQSGSYDRIGELLNHLNNTSQQALREMRLMLHKLRPPDLDEEGLVGALQQRLDEVETRANVEAHLIIEGDLDELPDAVEDQLYRIAQEALNNALKHSAATLLTVRISADEDDIQLEISDDGRGFDVIVAQEDGGMGLQNIEERVEELEGDLTIESTLGEGTTITVQIDLDEVDWDAEDELF